MCARNARKEIVLSKGEETYLQRSNLKCINYFLCFS